MFRREQFSERGKALLLFFLYFALEKAEGRRQRGQSESFFIFFCALLFRELCALSSFSLFSLSFLSLFSQACARFCSNSLHT